MALKDDARASRTGSLGWMIQRIAGRLNRAMDAKLAEHDLSRLSFAVIMTVIETDGLSQTEIGTTFSEPPYAISRALDRLEKAGLVERRPHPTSRRTHTIHATDKGRALSGTLFRIVREVNDELTAPLSDAQRVQFRTLLETLL